MTLHQVPAYLLEVDAGRHPITLKEEAFRSHLATRPLTGQRTIAAPLVFAGMCASIGVGGHGKRLICGIPISDKIDLAGPGRRPPPTGKTALDLTNPSGYHPPPVLTGQPFAPLAVAS